MSTNPPSYPPPPGAPLPPPAGKKTSPIVWILGIIAGFAVLVMVGCLAVGLFVAHKVNQAGGDFKKNPGFATAKLIVSMNPDIDLVSSNEDKGTLTVRDKKTGKTITMNFEDAKNGKFVFSDEDGKQSTITASGGADGKGTFEVNSSEGSFKMGAGGKLPAWVPVYPGSTPKANFSARGKEGESGSFQFATKDSAEKVAAFYNGKLKSDGFKITGSFAGQVTDQSGSMITAEDASNNHTLVVTVGHDGDGSTVNVTFAAKN
jgi:hypothetical protein